MNKLSGRRHAMTSRFFRLAIAVVTACAAGLVPLTARAAEVFPFAPDGGLRRPDALFVCGALLMMGLYHLVIFFSRKTNLASLALAVYCLLRTGNSLCSRGGDWSIRLFVQTLDPQIVELVGDACLTLSFPVLQYFFFCVFPRQFPRWGLQGFTVGSLVFLVVDLGNGFAGSELIALACLVLAFSAWSIANLARAWRAGEDGARLLLAGYVFMVLCAINDVLIGARVIAGPLLAPVGTLVFLLAQSSLLAYRFAHAFSSAELLSARLEKQNRTLEAEIAERNRLEEKLNTLSEDERRFVSRALHDGLCQELAAARLRCSLLLSSAAPAGGNARELEKLASLLEGAVDQACELSHGLWPDGKEITDLPRALRELGEEMTAEHGIEVTLRDESEGARPTRVQVEHVYLIAKEALKNVVKHAQARHVEVALRRVEDEDGCRFELSVADDGVGLGAALPQKGGLGARIMAHHADTIGGRLSLSPGAVNGTRVSLSLPCAA